MPDSTDIALPRAAEARFPPACVACGADEPTELLRYKGRTQSWLGLFWLHIGRRFTVDVPCCTTCRKRLRRLRTQRAVWFLVALVVALTVVGPLIGDLPSGVRRTVGIVTLLVVLSPIIVYEVLFPMPFDLTVYRDTVNYEFVDADYAMRFLELNGEQGAEEV